MTSEWEGLVVLAVAAAPCVGSFLGLLAHRLPAGEGVVWGRSRCRSCDTRLALRDLVPVASWLHGRGRCRYCAAAIGRTYPAMELGALAVAVWSASALPAAALLAGCVLGWALLTLAVIDQRHLILPDELTLPLIPLGLAATWSAAPQALPAHALGAALGFVTFAGIRLAYRRLRRVEGLGLGDAKLLAAAGAWVSWTGLPSVVLIAAITAGAAALLLRLGRTDPLPFGGHLALALWLVWLYGPLV